MNSEAVLDIENLIAVAGKVCVLMGGCTSEREISLKSGSAILESLINAGVDAYAYDWDGVTTKKLLKPDFDTCFIALHGRGGEDGKVQGLLDLSDIPYTGTGMVGSAIAMDKFFTKVIFKSLDIPTPEFLLINDQLSDDDILSKLGLPIFLKPCREGSSIGISKVMNKKDLRAAINLAKKYDKKIIAETAIIGPEYTQGILADSTLPIIELKTDRDFYDYHAKYVSDSTRYICPADLTPADVISARKIANRAFSSLDCRGWARVDFMRDAAGAFQVIEINTVPGMTKTSLLPKAAAAVGLSFDDLVLKILASSFFVGEVT